MARTLKDLITGDSAVPKGAAPAGAEPVGAEPAGAPSGATEVAPPHGAEPADSSIGGVLKSGAQQFLSGLDDVTWLLAKPIESNFGTVRIPLDQGPLAALTQMEYISPEEVMRQRASGELGIPGRTTEEPSGMIEHGMRFAGQTAAAGPIMGRVFSAVEAPAAGATGVGSKVRGIVSTMGRTWAKAPGKASIGDITSGFAAGSGGYAANQLFPDSHVARFLGEMLGGVAPAFMPTRLAIKAGGGLRTIYNTLKHPFTEIGGRIRAGQRAKRAISGQSRRAALSELEKPTTIDPATGKPVLTPAQRTGEPGLLSMERSIIDSSETLRNQGDEQIATANRVIQQSLEGVAGGADTGVLTTTIKEGQEYMANLLDTRLRIAAQATDDRIADLGKGVTREHANRIAKEELEGALDAARAQERELYNAIPENTPVPYARTAQKLAYHLKSLGTAQKGDVPRIAKELLDPESSKFIGKVEGMAPGETSIKELRALQTKLREVARNARAGDKKQLNLARIADDLANTINDDLAHATGGEGVSASETAQAIQTAVEFSRNLNDRFGSPTISKLLGRTSTGAAKVPAGLTLEESIGVTGPKAREAMDQIMNAFDTPQVAGHAQIIEATSDYIRAKFLRETTIRGEFNPRYAERFLKNNEELLKRMPDVEAQLQEATKTGNKLAVTLRQNSRVKLDDPRVSKATMLLQKGPVETFRSISNLDAKKMGNEVQKLINTASKDATGEALDGLKSGFLEYLYSQARTGTRDITGRKFMSGYSLKENLDKMGPAVKKLFTPDQINRIQLIQEDLIKLEKRLSAPLAKEGVLQDKPSKLIEMVAGIAGAAVGRSEARRLGIGGTVQIPGIMSQRFKELANAGVKDPASRLLRDSVFDESLYKELLSVNLKPDQPLPKEAVRKLNAWAAVAMAEYGGSINEDNQ